MCFIFLTGCSSGGTTNNSSNNGGSLIKIGTLPNGSGVYISANNLSVTATSPQKEAIYLVGGSDNQSFSIDFSSVKLLAVNPLRKSTENMLKAGVGTNGVSVSPNSCLIGTPGSGIANSCEVEISVSPTTYGGTYKIIPMVTSKSMEETTLNPITILVNGPIAPSTKEITSFSLNGIEGVITGTNIAVTMPYGTGVSSLVAAYITTGNTVTVNGVTQVDGQTANNFSNPVTYTVHAEDGSTRDYTVKVTVAPAAKFYAYVTNSNSNAVTKCIVNSDGSFSNCVNSGGTGFSSPSGIVLAI